MKFLLTVAAVIAVAVAVPAQRGLVAVAPAGPVFAPEPVAVGPAIIDSFEPIAIGPAIISPIEGVVVGPAIVENFEPISVGPAIIPFPVPESALAEEPAIAPSPVSIVEGVVSEVATGTPLVQIILNINQAAVESNPIAVGPAVIPEQVKPEPVQVVEIAPEPVQVVEIAPMPVEPVQVVEIAPEPVQVVEIAPEPVQVVEIAPVPVEPIQIGVPVLPEAAVVLPEELN